MTIRNLAALRVPVLLAAVGVLFTLHLSGARAIQAPKPLVIAVDWTKEGTRYAVDGRRTSDLSRTLSESLLKLGMRHPIVVLLDQRVQVVQMFDVKGLLDMIGADEPARFFVVNKESQRMVELVMRQSVPVSSNPGKDGRKLTDGER